MNKLLFILVGLGGIGLIIVIVTLIVVFRHGNMFKEQIIAERDDRRESIERQTRYREFVLQKADEATMSERSSCTSISDSQTDMSLSGFVNV